MTEQRKHRSPLVGLYNALVRRDPMERFRLLRKLSRWLVPEYRLKWPEMDWWGDDYFNEYLNRFNETEGLNTDRRWMLYQLARLTAYVPGDTAECGSYEGAASYLICATNSAAGNHRKHYIFDSFDGLSEVSAADGDYWTRGDLTASRQALNANLSEFSDQVEVYPGWIPDTFAELEQELAQNSAHPGFAFVHIDVDLYEPTLASFEYFYPRLAPGGILLCDDYGLAFCPGATEACEKFVADKPEKMIALSGGSGYLVKGQRTQGPLQKQR